MYAISVQKFESMALFRSGRYIFMPLLIVGCFPVLRPSILTTGQCVHSTLDCREPFLSVVSIEESILHTQINYINDLIPQKDIHI